MKTYRWTLIGALLATLLWIYSVTVHVDFFETLVSFMERAERYEIDELIFPTMLFTIFALIDQLRRRRSLEIEVEKAKVYRAMLHSSHHILNNFLNQMQLFRMMALETSKAPQEEVVDLYDRIIASAETQIEALGSITRIDEESIVESVAPK